LITSVVLMRRYHTSAARVRGGRPRLPLHCTRTDGARHWEPHVYRGWAVLRQPVWHQHSVCQGGCSAGTFLFQF